MNKQLNFNEFSSLSYYEAFDKDAATKELSRVVHDRTMDQWVQIWESIGEYISEEIL